MNAWTIVSRAWTAMDAAREDLRALIAKGTPEERRQAGDALASLPEPPAIHDSEWQRQCDREAERMNGESEAA